MDDKQFDQLVRRLSEIASRRRVMTGTAATIAGAAISTRGEDVAAQRGTQLSADNCTPDGLHCGKRRGRGKSVKPCRRCCSRYARGKGKRRRCRCRPPGRKCAPSKGFQCCTGFCSDDRRCAHFPVYGARAAG